MKKNALLAALRLACCEVKISSTHIFAKQGPFCSMFVPVQVQNRNTGRWHTEWQPNYDRWDKVDVFQVGWPMRFFVPIFGPFSLRVETAVQLPVAIPAVSPRGTEPTRLLLRTTVSAIDDSKLLNWHEIITSDQLAVSLVYQMWARSTDLNYTPSAAAIPDLVNPFMDRLQELDPRFADFYNAHGVPHEARNNP